MDSRPETDQRVPSYEPAMNYVEASRDLAGIKAISFDADGTLWDFQAAMEFALELTLRQLRLIVPNDATQRLTVQKMIDIRESVAKELGEEVVGHEEIRYAAFLRTLENVDAPSQSIAEQLYRLYMDARFSATKPFPDVAVVLRNLKSRYRIGLISNGNSYPERCGLPNMFDFTVFGQECGSRKPDRRIFEFALLRSGCRPEEVLHVGDSLDSDVMGANMSGLRSVWLNRDLSANETDIIPGLEVRDLSELADWV